jgi:iron complex outermembrane receptor protein
VQPSRTTSFYASWSRSFAPSLNVPSFGEPTFPPEQGEQFELGVKRESEDGRFSATLAVYELANHNVLVPDLADPLNQRWKVGGLQRSQGIEIDATGNLSPGLAVVLAYAYTDAWVAPNEDDPLAHAYPNQPRHRGSLWAKYTAQSGALRGAAAGAGVTAADGQYADFDAGLHLPGYTIVDAMLGYQFRAVTFQFNFDNLTDARTYQAAGQAVVPGAPRSARTSVAYRW